MIKIGIIGMGIRGTMFADTIGQNHYAEVAAFSEYNDQVLEQVKASYPVPAYKDFKEMIDQEELDAVIVATPDFLHKEAVVYAADHGLHILCEKPFSTSSAECEEMVAAIQKNKVKCMVAFENHWNLPYVNAKQQMETIGKVLNVNARLNDTIFVPTELLPWGPKSTVGWFLFPHMVDMISWLSGDKEVDSVYGVGTKQKLASMGLDTYDTIQTVLNYKDGTHATISSSWVLPSAMPLIYDNKMEIIGENGALYIDTNDQMLRMGTADAFTHPHTLGTRVNGMDTGGANFMLHHFVDCLRNDQPIEANEEAGLLNTRIVEAIHQSVETGQVVKV